MQKSNFLEFSKVYNFTQTIEKEYIFISNVKYYKNPNNNTQDILKSKFYQYFDIEKKSRQKFKNRKNVEGYKIKILVSPILLQKENRKKLREYIDSTIELITDIPKEKLKWVAVKEKTVGGSNYLNIYFIDRVIYEIKRTRVINRVIYINKDTNKICKKEDENAIKKEIIKEKEIFFSDKIRFKLIHQKSKENFIQMIEILKTNLKLLEEKIFNNLTTIFYGFKKQVLKKKKKLENGQVIYINNNDNYFEDIEYEYQKRYIRSYNSLINTLNLNSGKLLDLDINRFKEELKSIKKKYYRNVHKYEKEISKIIQMITIDTDEFLQKF